MPFFEKIFKETSLILSASNISIDSSSGILLFFDELKNEEDILEDIQYENTREMQNYVDFLRFCQIRRQTIENDSKNN